jgi:surfactin synthase thioesterase subunit
MFSHEWINYVSGGIDASAIKKYPGRQHKLANSCFSGSENMVDRVSDAWNAFREYTNRVKPICTKSWADLIT